MASSDWKLLVDVQLNATKESIQQKLDALTKNLNVNADVNITTNASDVRREIEAAVQAATSGIGGASINLPIDTTAARNATQDLDDLGDAAEEASVGAEDLTLSYQAANAILSKSLELIGAMVEQTYELDSSLTE